MKRVGCNSIVSVCLAHMKSQTTHTQWCFIISNSSTQKVKTGKWDIVGYPHLHMSSMPSILHDTLSQLKKKKKPEWW